MHPNCEACRRLWAEYGKATKSYIALDSKLRLEGLINDYADLADVTRWVEDAERDRAVAREAIRRHDAAWEAAESGTPQLETDDEESRMLTILTECGERVRVQRLEIERPTRSRLLADYTILINDLEDLRVHRGRVLAQLREYRNLKATLSLSRSKSASD